MMQVVLENMRFKDYTVKTKENKGTSYRNSRNPKNK